MSFLVIIKLTKIRWKFYLCVCTIGSVLTDQTNY